MDAPKVSRVQTVDRGRIMTTGVSLFTERMQAINQEYQLLFQRSLVDLALSDRHAYWNVETLEEAT